MPPLARSLTYILAGLYAALGLWLYLAPETLSNAFAWKVSPFQAMTIGGWCLGNAWFAFLCARRWLWPQVHPSLLYLWLFGVFEALVLVAFRARLLLDAPAAWLYMAALALNLLLALWGGWWWRRFRPALSAEGQPISPLARRLALVFAVFVGFLGLYGLFAPLGSVGTNGGIFPEVMGAFTLRAFGAFYLALAVSAIPVWRGVNLKTLWLHGQAGLGLIVTVSIPFIAYWDLFDFANHPGQWAYVLVYAIVGTVLAAVLVRHRQINAA